MTQAIAAGTQAAAAKPISTISIWPTPVLKRKVSTIDPSTAKTPTWAAAAAAPITPATVAMALTIEATKTASTTRRRQMAPPAGTSASRVYQTKAPVPTVVAAPNVPNARTTANGSIITGFYAGFLIVKVSLSSTT